MVIAFSDEIEVNDMEVCAITMVRDDLFYIKRWIEYYGAQLGHKNLYVLVHGNSKQIRSLAAEVNYFNVPACQGDTKGGKNFNFDRFELINNIANGLQAYYDFVVVVDVDEFIVVDPDISSGLSEYLSSIQEPMTLTAFGLDVYHHIERYPTTIDLSKPILLQRPVCKVEPLYCKPAITNKKVRRGIGNHYTNDRRLYFAHGLYLFHMKYMDQVFSLGRHPHRNKLRGNQQTELKLFPSDDSADLNYRESIVSRYEGITKLPVTERFDFSYEKQAYEATWRRRRFFLQSDFWRSILDSRLSDYSFHWRFDPIRYDMLHMIPQRFRELV